MPERKLLLDRKSHRKKVKNLRSSLVPQPQPYTPGYVFRRKFRYVSTTQGTSIVTNLNLCNAVGMVATTTTVAYPLCQACRIRSIECWQTGTDAVPIVNESPTITWSGNIFGPQSMRLNTSISPNQVTYLKSRPPKMGAGSFWNEQSASAVTVFTLNYGPNMLIDLDMDVVFYNGLWTSSPVDLTGLSGLTVGTIYLGALDGLGGALSAVGGQGL